VADDKKNAANNQFRKARQAEEGKRAMTEYENAAVATRAKTERLKALRLAHEAEEAAKLAANPPPPKKKKAAKKKEAAEG
jgi:hypothetical protein